jgi:hypothetical protein
VPDDGFMKNEPDTTMVRNVHNQMRRDTRRFAEAVLTATPADRAGRLKPLARWAVGFGHELHVHHTIEDAVVFRHLAARVPSVRSVLDSLEADHETVAAILEEWGPAAHRLADPSAPFGPAQSRMLELATSLRDLLSRHLDIEDNEVFPLFPVHFTLAEYEAMDAEALKALPKKGLGFSIPWNVYAQDEAARAELIAGAPLPLRLIFRLTKGRFERLVAAAFPFGQKPVVTTGF